MKRILFVDDEPMILDGLRDLLRKQRKEWEMVFALGGEQAVAELERGAFDVVVSDMRMPGIDGIMVLQKVKDLYPMTARIILSGHAERSAVVTALTVAHQFLSKPCNGEELQAVLERTCGLHTLLDNDSLRQFIGRIDRLPSVPRTYLELTEAAIRPDVGLADLARIVERDPAMATKVLQLVNSAYFGQARSHSSIPEAVAYLGSELLKALALTAHVFLAARDPGVAGFSLEELQAHSVLTARLAHRMLSGKRQAEEVFTAAIVHDIGKIVLAMGIPERYAEVIADCRATGRPSFVVERERLGFTHAEVGAYLLGLWGVPLDIVEAVAFHHQPEKATPCVTAVALHVADAVANATPGTPFDPATDSRLNLEFVTASPFGASLSGWLALAETERCVGSLTT